MQLPCEIRVFDFTYNCLSVRLPRLIRKSQKWENIIVLWFLRVILLWNWLCLFNFLLLICRLPVSSFDCPYEASKQLNTLNFRLARGAMHWPLSAVTLIISSNSSC